ncbi:MAG TPA: hypothetical protein VFA87_02265 [Rhizomicrobium sp.]|nr:hypothetical protein [Rhizomicrobium sp.]
MSEDIDRINAEIDRLALQTTDPKPMQLFVERENLRRRAQIWILGGGAAAVALGCIAFFVFFGNSDYGFLEGAGVAAVLYFLISIVGRRDLNTRMADWLARARQVVGG